MPRMFFPQYKRGRNGIECFEGTILAHARKLGIELAAECGGRGQCRRCVVRVDRGAEALAPKTTAELGADLSEGERLACQARVAVPADIRVYAKAGAPYTILLSAQHQTVDLAPVTYRTRESVVRRTPSGEEVLEPYRDGIYGLGIGVGTTTLVFEIADLESGATLATLAQRNPQTAYGDDVISRIGYARDHEGDLAELQAAVVNAINEALAQWEQESQQVTDRTYEVTVVGNPTMRDILFAMDVSSLAGIPFQPQSTAPVERSASDLGLHLNRAARVYGGRSSADTLAPMRWPMCSPAECTPGSNPLW